jgi:CRP-like cAMP-binding protein
LPEHNILFNGVDDYDCHRMFKCFNMEVKKFRTGSCISDYSKQGDKIGIILKGCADVVRYDVNGVRTIIETLGEQGIFGEYFTYPSSTRSYVEVVAGRDCEILYVRRSELLKRCENACGCHSRVVENMLELMTEKAISLSERVEVLSQRTIENKLISFLQITEDKTAEGKTPQIPFSTTVLSDYLCVNRSALQREIAKLKKSGVLTISKRKFRLTINHEN